jgi:hypothetical protein
MTSFLSEIVTLVAVTGAIASCSPSNGSAATSSRDDAGASR